MVEMFKERPKEPETVTTTSRPTITITRTIATEVHQPLDSLTRMREHFGYRAESTHRNPADANFALFIVGNRERFFNEGSPSVPTLFARMLSETV